MSKPNVFEFIGFSVVFTLGMGFAAIVVLAVLTFFLGGPADLKLAQTQIELTDCRAKLAAVGQGKGE